MRAEKSMGSRFLGGLMAFLFFVSLFGCVAAIPIIIYKKSTKYYTAKVQIRADANDTYQTALTIIGEKPDVEIVEKDDEELEVEVKKGEQSGKVKVTPLKRGETLLIVKADAGNGKEVDKELALRIVKTICDRMGVQYTVAEK